MNKSQFIAGKWILIVEDDPEISELLEILLISNGYNVVRASDGNEAFEIYRSHSPKFDLVISDLGLPSLGGLELFQKIFSIDNSVKFIASSGYNHKNFSEELKIQGIRAFLPKPYHAESLLQTIKKILEED
ncbi:MAG: diguanylate cyclase/phosphodiesterase (GGDEF & EAL domains) with PAS/PAC sensor(s) [Ignavibacteriae bacterium]|nr:MAG: diguanylate cyclase/phosphodiesterase (GGDEF & EAL domains) with PAS/PAC sensor(s) [Ignavibacteriota bacterium]